MANEVYVCLKRTDIPQGTLQLLDLWPQESQRAGVYTPPGQTKYLRIYQNESVTVHADGGLNRYVSSTTKGLAAYLIDTVEAGGIGAGIDAFTATQANDAAAAIIAISTAGTILRLQEVDAALNGIVAQSELTTSGGSLSIGSLSEVLRILSGDEYVVPGGSMIATGVGGGTFVPTKAGAFTTGVYRQLYTTSSFVLSNAVGQLSKLKAATFEYDGTTGSAVAVYSETGTVL